MHVKFQDHITLILKKILTYIDMAAILVVRPGPFICRRHLRSFLTCIWVFSIWKMKKATNCISLKRYFKMMFFFFFFFFAIIIQVIIDPYCYSF